MPQSRMYRKGEIRQFHVAKVPSERKIIAVLENKAEQFPFWPDGTPKSLANDFNWRNGDPSIFNKGKSQ